jgi:hypothetical protein
MSIQARRPKLARPGDDRNRNPFRPTPSDPPLVLAGRASELKWLIDQLEDVPEIPLVIRMTGVRGIGKTVLLKQFISDSKELGWASCWLSIGGRYNYEGELASALGAAANQARESLSALMGLRRRVADAATAVAGQVMIGYGDWTGSLAGAREEAIDLGKALADLAETAVEAGRRGCVLAIDEAQLLQDNPANDQFPLELLLSTVTDLQLAGCPLVLILSGLRSLNRNIGATRSQSERNFHALELKALDEDASRKAFLGPLQRTTISATPQAVEAVMDAVHGYPHFIQVYGAVLFSAPRKARLRSMGVRLLRATQPDIEDRITRDIYRFRMAQLKPEERDLLIIAARSGLPPFAIADLVSAGVQEDACRPVVERLQDLGMLDDPADRGEFDFTVPGFHKYLLGSTEWSSRRTDRQPRGHGLQDGPCSAPGAVSGKGD